MLREDFVCSHLHRVCPVLHLFNADDRLASRFPVMGMRTFFNGDFLRWIFVSVNLRKSQPALCMEGLLLQNECTPRSSLRGGIDSLLGFHLQCFGTGLVVF